MGAGPDTAIRAAIAKAMFMAKTCSLPFDCNNLTLTLWAISN